jgi:hypothetical protein
MSTVSHPSEVWGVVLVTAIGARYCLASSG